MINILVTTIVLFYSRQIVLRNSLISSFKGSQSSSSLSGSGGYKDPQEAHSPVDSIIFIKCIEMDIHAMNIH